MSFTMFLWLIWDRMTTSLMNSPTLSWSTTVDFFTATILPSTSIPLYTVPWPPFPSTLVELKFSVAFFSSFEVNTFVFSMLPSVEVNCCFNNKPPLRLNNFLLPMIFLCFLINLHNRKATAKTIISTPKPTHSPGNPQEMWKAYLSFVPLR